MDKGNSTYYFMTKSNDIAAEGGFTLIEVLIAMFITSIALIALASLAVTSIRATSGGRNLTQALTLATDKLESLKAVPYHSLHYTGADGGITRTCTVPASVATPPVFDCTEKTAAGANNNVITFGGMKYTWTWRVSYIDIDGDTVYYLDPTNAATNKYRIENSDAKLMAVTVTWQDLFGSRSIKLTNLRTKL